MIWRQIDTDISNRVLSSEENIILISETGKQNPQYCITVPIIDQNNKID